MDWNEVCRRIADGEDVTHVLDMKSADDRARFRAFLMEEEKTNPRARDALASFDQSMKDLDTGVSGAQSTWSALSQAQRAVLQEATEGDGRATQDPHNPNRFTMKVRMGCVIAIRRPTIRALCERELMAWDGGAFNPEAAAVITERGRFAVTHGGSYGYGG
jgi:hypothetical protein